MPKGESAFGAESLPVEAKPPARPLQTMLGVFDLHTQFSKKQKPDYAKQSGIRSIQQKLVQNLPII